MPDQGNQANSDDVKARQLKSLLEGDNKATEQFVRQHCGWMLKVARRVVGAEIDAEDVVQAAFSNIFNKLGSFNSRSSLKTWMYRIVVNEALMLLRKRDRRRESSLDGLMPVFDANGCRVEGDWAEIRTPENLMQQSQTADRVTEMIRQLPENYRIVLVLRDIEELSTPEVAEILELSEANVKVRLHRARSALKKLLEPLFRGGQL